MECKHPHHFFLFLRNFRFIFDIIKFSKNLYLILIFQLMFSFLFISFFFPHILIPSFKAIFIWFVPTNSLFHKLYFNKVRFFLCFGCCKFTLPFSFLVACFDIGLNFHSLFSILLALHNIEKKCVMQINV